MIKAIQTVYKGYRFRSRLEARWAVFFDAVGIQWEYEKEGFDVDGTWYLPDFWLPQHKYWIEIKPDIDGKTIMKDEKKWISFSKELKEERLFILWGNPWRPRMFDVDVSHADYSVLSSYKKIERTGEEWCCCPLCGRLDLFGPYMSYDNEWAVYCFNCDINPNERKNTPKAWFHKGNSITNDPSLIFTDQLFYAYCRARSARFEHGETPVIVKPKSTPAAITTVQSDNFMDSDDVVDHAANAMTMVQQNSALKVLATEIHDCMRCTELCSTRTQTVFGQGMIRPEVCFVGEAPGADEDTHGEPFVGAAGMLLNNIIQSCGWKREEVYLCNIVKCRPPGSRTPLANETANCRDFLERQLTLVQPKYIVALGSCAASNLLNSAIGLSKLRGRFHDWHGIPVLVTYHPAFLLPHRQPEKKRDVWEDMNLLLARLGKSKVTT